MRFPAILPRRLLVWLMFVGGLGAARLLAAEAGAEVVVIYNTQVPESREVAEYYAGKRGVPASQLLGYGFANNSGLDRAEYQKFVEDFLIKELEARGLATFTRDIVPGQGLRPGRVVYKAREASFRTLLLTYGVPYIIREAVLEDEGPEKTQEAMRKNRACFDNELMLMPVHGRVRYTGVTQNPFYGQTNAALLHPTNGVVMVSRLDGPSPELAKGLVDKALIAEREGLWGRAYFDLRNITTGGYAPGDQWLTNASRAAKFFGFETYVDNEPAVINNAFPMSQIALYFGWYDGSPVGPFTLPTVEFAPGAIAYHIHSYSAGNPRSHNLHWVGPLITKGAAVTMGCVDEPYLTFTPHPDKFLEALLARGMSVGEAAVVSQFGLSWQTIFLGDPLYRPFSRNILERIQDLQERNSPLLEWAELQKINMHLFQGRDPVIAREYLSQLPFAEKSAVICEKVGDMFADKGNYRLAINWLQKAIANGGTPQQRVRMLRNLADWQRINDQWADSFNTLSQFVLEFPGHPDLLGVRKEQLRLARDLDRADDIQRLQDEVTRLTPPPPPEPAK